jgi:hypothetical protein
LGFLWFAYRLSELPPLVRVALCWLALLAINMFERIRDWWRSRIDEKEDQSSFEVVPCESSGS